MYSRVDLIYKQWPNYIKNGYLRVITILIKIILPKVDEMIQQWPNYIKNDWRDENYEQYFLKSFVNNSPAMIYWLLCHVAYEHRRLNMALLFQEKNTMRWRITPLSSTRTSIFNHASVPRVPDIRCSPPLSWMISPNSPKTRPFPHKLRRASYTNVMNGAEMFSMLSIRVFSRTIIKIRA